MIERFTKLMHTGASLYAICEACGISFTTYRAWYKLGQKEGQLEGADSLYADFVEAVDRTQGEVEIMASAKLVSYFDSDWRAIVAWLERRHPERWSRHRVEHTVDHRDQVTMHDILAAQKDLEGRLVDGSIEDVDAAIMRRLEAAN